MRLTFPHTTRNGSGFPGQEKVSLRIGIRDSRGSPSFLTTINNRIRSAIGDFVSHSRRPRRGQSGTEPLCVVESFLFRCILALFDPVSPMHREIIMKPHVSRSICDFGRRTMACR